MNPDIVCCECGETCGTRDEHAARELGWEGFSDPLPLKQLDGTTRMERIGECPDCVFEDQWREIRRNLERELI